jgi:hypothetical protein
MAYAFPSRQMDFIDFMGYGGAAAALYFLATGMGVGAFFLGGRRSPERVGKWAAGLLITHGIIAGLIVLGVAVRIILR